MALKRVLSGMQPSGKLHLGNVVGAVNNWLKLQEEYDSFFFIADWHALTTHYEHTENLVQNKREMMIDWLTVGLDPEKATLFVQSDRKEHAELHPILSMITPLSWLERVPTYKEKMAQIQGRDLSTYGFLGYPVLQTADILLYKSDIVPVGIDQLPHLELAREIVRTFHHVYKKEIFTEPQSKMTEIPKLTGNDGRKMSKSYGNALFISDPEEEVRKKIMSYVTDTARIKKTDPGSPENCNLFPLHKIFTNQEKNNEIVESCKNASIGCVDCKKIAVDSVNKYLEPIKEKRREVEALKDDIVDMYKQGTDKARTIAQGTMELVNKTIRI
ncbi:MAG: tryptophan--tRNA ligase [Nitrospinae bacterium]|nr:tryptophan--tRNA ligase [Nitrospinota bacterium]